MPITGPSTAVEGDNAVALVGSNMSTIAPLYVVATDGVDEYQLQMVTANETPTGRDVNLQMGLQKKIDGNAGSLAGLPLTDSVWSLKWRTLADDELTPIEFPVTITAPANYAIREVNHDDICPDNSWFDGINNLFGEQDQQASPTVITSVEVNYIKSNGKSLGYLDGSGNFLLTQLRTFFWTQSDQKYRWRDSLLAPFQSVPLTADTTIFTADTILLTADQTEV